MQSAETNDGDVDNETGENFLSKTPENAVDDESRLEGFENLDIEQYENDLENPPTPIQSDNDDDDDDVNVRSAQNPRETGEGTRNESGLTGNEATTDEVHDL